MAVMAMNRIRLCGMKHDRKQVLELLQRRGTVEISDAAMQDEVFYIEDKTASVAVFEKNMNTAKAALDLLAKYAPAKEGIAFLHGRTAVSVQQNSDFAANMDDVLRVAMRIVQLERDMAEAKAETARAEAGIEALKPWLTLPVSQAFRGTRKTTAFIGALDGQYDLNGIYASLAGVAPELSAIHVEVISSSKAQTAIMALALKTQEAEAEEALRAIGFARVASPTSRVPQAKTEQLEKDLEKAKHDAIDARKELESYADKRSDIRYLEDYLKMRAEKYKMIQRLAHTKHTFVLEGYVPVDNCPTLEKELVDGYGVAVDFTLAEQPGGEVPVALKNSWFAEPVTSVLEAYSLPGKGEIDPTGVMSIFYYIMFGLMFSDAGYGLVMFTICYICLVRYKNMEPNWNRNVRMFMWCGVSTTIWGIVFSSYFGDVVDVVSSTFFGKAITIKPLWFYPTENPMLLLVFCLGIGIVHLSVGYIVKGINCYIRKDYSGIVYDAVLPITLWYPLVAVFMSTDIFANMGGFKLTLPTGASNILLAIAGVSVVGILLTGGRESKNWGKRIAKGLYAVYNTASGWLSDMLSYSRLLALGLATGVIAGVFNKLGTLAGGSVVGVIMFLVVFAIGQSLNFGINVLGAYVHSNRLEYVEFFGKFYDGGGHKFSPFGMHTKYYKIVEEDTSK